MSRLSSPFDFAEHLGVTLNDSQKELLQRFADDEKHIETSLEPGSKVSQAVAIGALWRLFLLPGSRLVIVAYSRHAGRLFMRLLHLLTMETDPLMAAVCRWRSWHSLQIGPDPGYGARFMSNRPEFALGMEDLPTTIVIVGARDNDFDFEKTQKALEPFLRREDTRLVRIW